MAGENKNSIEEENSSWPGKNDACLENCSKKSCWYGLNGSNHHEDNRIKVSLPGGDIGW